MMLDLNTQTLPHLRNLVIDVNAVRPGQLERLPNLESLILNEVTDVRLADIRNLNKLRTLGIGTAEETRDARPEDSDKHNTLQELIDRLPLQRLILIDRNRFRKLDHLPSTVDSLDLEGNGFGLKLGMNWYSDTFFEQTYGNTSMWGTD